LARKGGAPAGGFESSSGIEVGQYSFRQLKTPCTGRTAATVLMTALLLLAGGCCSLARLFCGPDLSPWVQRSFDTPFAAAKTFMEAARRDDSTIIWYECLAKSYKARLKNEHGQAGAFEIRWAWERMKQDAPLHMLGYATVTEPKEDGNRATCVLDVEGRSVRIELVRQAGWLVEVRDEHGVIQKISGLVDSLDSRAKIVDGKPPRLELVPFLLQHDELNSVSPDQIVRAQVSHEWKIDLIELVK
jgi:hypothetical protein